MLATLFVGTRSRRHGAHRQRVAEVAAMGKGEERVVYCAVSGACVWMPRGGESSTACTGGGSAPHPRDVRGGGGPGANPIACQDGRLPTWDLLAGASVATGLAAGYRAAASATAAATMGIASASPQSRYASHWRTRFFLAGGSPMRTMNSRWSGRVASGNMSSPSFPVEVGLYQCLLCRPSSSMTARSLSGCETGGRRT